MSYREIHADLIEFAKNEADVVVHGCNCFSKMGAGIAVVMAKEFGCDKFPSEVRNIVPIHKLGNIDPRVQVVQVASGTTRRLVVVNAYTQYHYGRGLNLDYAALTVCLRKINSLFKGKVVAMPKIGCGLAGGDWEAVSSIIKLNVPDCEVVICIKNG